MALDEFDRAVVEVAMERFLEAKRPPVEMRDKIDFAYRIEGQSVVIFEVRPYWRDPQEKIEGPVAKAMAIASERLAGNM